MLVSGVGFQWTVSPWLQVAARCDTLGEGKLAVTMGMPAVPLLNWLLPKARSATDPAPPGGAPTAVPPVAVVDVSASQYRHGALTADVIRCPLLQGRTVVAGLSYELEHAVVVELPSVSSRLVKVIGRVRC